MSLKLLIIFMIKFKTDCFDMNIRLILDDIKNLNFEQSMVAHRSHPNFHY